MSLYNVVSMSLYYVVSMFPDTLRDMIYIISDAYSDTLHNMICKYSDSLHKMKCVWMCMICICSDPIQMTCISCVWRVMMRMTCYDACTSSHHTHLQSRIAAWFLPVCHTLHNMICIHSDTLHNMTCVSFLSFVHVPTLYKWFAIMCIHSHTLHTCGAGSRHHACRCLIPYTTCSIYILIPYTKWHVV